MEFQNILTGILSRALVYEPVKRGAVHESFRRRRAGTNRRAVVRLRLRQHLRRGAAPCRAQGLWSPGSSSNRATSEHGWNADGAVKLVHTKHARESLPPTAPY